MEKRKLDVKLKWSSNKEGEEEGFKVIGRVISKTKAGLGTVRDSVSAAWKVEGALDVKIIGFNLFSFTFKVEEEANRILRENPWIVRNYMLSLQKRKPYLSDNEMQINTCAFWVQFHNIPPEGRLRSNIELLANLVGRVVEIESPGEKRFCSRSFGRARVEIDVNKSLAPGFSASRPDKSLEDIWIQAKYEKLVRYCYNCGKLGHESKGYEEDAVEFMVNGNLKGYDASLCAQAFRSLEIIQGNWYSGRTSEGRVVHGEGRYNKCLSGGCLEVRR